RRGAQRRRDLRHASDRGGVPAAGLVPAAARVRAGVGDGAAPGRRRVHAEPGLLLAGDDLLVLAVRAAADDAPARRGVGPPVRERRHSCWRKQVLIGAPGRRPPWTAPKAGTTGCPPAAWG